ncbi:phosphomannomutase/phosphoglucomutase [Thermodesulfobacteriota bacterium]
MFNDEIIKMYDIRGKYKEQFDLEFVTNLAKAFCTFLIDHDFAINSKRVSVGYDARLSSPEIRDAFIKGVLESGFDAVDIGLCPTPLLYYSLQKDDFSGGVMITASHNPPSYNGFKISAGSDSIYGDALIEIKKCILDNTYKKLDRNIQKSSVTSFDDHYLEYCDEYFHKADKKLRVAVDAGNGAGGQLLVDALKKFGCEVYELYIEPDGHFPNHHPDPSKIENMQDLINCVRENDLDIGIALDGDGDRLGVVDNNGNIVAPDIYMILFIKEILEKNSDAIFISEVKCSQVLYDEVRKAGGEIIMYKTGHSLIKNKMKELGASFAGEMSGHLFFKDDYFGYDDAIYSGMRLARILSKSDKSLSEMVEPYNIYESTPEIRIEVNEKTKFIDMDKLTKYFFELKTDDASIKDIITIDGARVLFENGWGLVRPSNTEPHFVLRFEANDSLALTKIKDYMIDKVEKVLS